MQVVSTFNLNIFKLNVLFKLDAFKLNGLWMVVILARTLARGVPSVTATRSIVLSVGFTSTVPDQGKAS